MTESTALVSSDFDAKVLRGDGCWEWQGKRLPTGYGRFWLNGKWVSAHRLLYERVVGPIPDGFYVCHHCDNPSCVRPDHLFAGSPTDNMQDMWAKGRGSVNSVPQPGESNPMCRLSEHDVVVIRRLAAKGVKQVLIAEVFGVSFQAVSDIVLVKKWKHVA